MAMAEIVLRVRLTGGEHIDITYKEPDTDNVDDGGSRSPLRRTWRISRT